MTAFRTIDPDTGDYVLQDGLFVQDSYLSTPVFLRLFSHRGTYIDDETYGSRLHELERAKSPESAARLAPSIVLEALQPLIDDGLASSVEVTAETEIRAIDGSSRRGCAIHVVVYDSGDRPYEYDVWQEVS